MDKVSWRFCSKCMDRTDHFYVNGEWICENNHEKVKKEEIKAIKNEIRAEHTHSFGT